MGVAPFTVVLTAGVKSHDAVSLLGKRTHDPCESLAMKCIWHRHSKGGSSKYCSGWKKFPLTTAVVKTLSPQRCSGHLMGNGIRKLLRGPERIHTFLCNLPSQFRSLPHRSPSHCPWRYTCPSLGQEQSWGWHSGDRLQLWRDRWKSVINWFKIYSSSSKSAINWFKIYSPSSSQLLSPQWLFSLVNRHPLFTQYQQLWTC